MQSVNKQLNNKNKMELPHIFVEFILIKPIKTQ